VGAWMCGCVGVCGCLLLLLRRRRRRRARLGCRPDAAAAHAANWRAVLAAQETVNAMLPKPTVATCHPLCLPCPSGQARLTSPPPSLRAGWTWWACCWSRSCCSTGAPTRSLW
jgi:hypothetical protein